MKTPIFALALLTSCIPFAPTERTTTIKVQTVPGPVGAPVGAPAQASTKTPQQWVQDFKLAKEGVFQDLQIASDNDWKALASGSIDHYHSSEIEDLIISLERYAQFLKNLQPNNPFIEAPFLRKRFLEANAIIRHLEVKLELDNVAPKGRK